ncbi:hypothetical protein R3W88_026995 [Solanum pinnatisectum]|uniref:Uncharacterized protein n=1 Tax=Solanum pinnatisectum TaxID=50273 RepID=A0AAV9LF14_9SOLN|nr:hypothetical protein R3W88_026995 [Solanum pinnatisectum]
MHYGGCFLSNPELRYANEISNLEKIRIDMDELHIMFFHKLARELGVEKVETFGCKGEDFVDVYVVHQISTPLIVEDPNEVQIAQFLTPKKGNPPPPPTIVNVRADVSSPQPSDKNDTNIKDQQPRVDNGKNKETTALEKNGYTTGTARTATGGSGGATTSAASTGVTGGATGGSGGANTSAASTGVTAGGSGGVATKRPVTTPATSRGATNSATCTDESGGATTKRPATTSAAFGGATSAATTTGGSAANISVNFASGANPGYKRPRTAGFGVLFGANGSVIERYRTTDRVLHCATLKSSVPTNIDLGYKPNGLRWEGEATVTQRQPQEQSYKRTTQSTPSTKDT